MLLVNGSRFPERGNMDINQYGCGSKLTMRGYASFGPRFQLPGFHFGTGFLSHSHMSFATTPRGLRSAAFTAAPCAGSQWPEQRPRLRGTVRGACRARRRRVRSPSSEKRGGRSNLGHLGAKKESLRPSRIDLFSSSGLIVGTHLH